MKLFTWISNIYWRWRFKRTVPSFEQLVSMQPSYPSWVCIDCGRRYGRRGNVNEYATWHHGQCDLCGEMRAVTEPRDFGHLILTAPPKEQSE